MNLSLGILFEIFTILFVHVMTIKAQSCPYSSFTWISNMHDDNPYFWKSPSFNWNATSTIAVFGDITSSQDRIEMRDYAQSLGISVVIAVGTGDLDFNNQTERKVWIDSTVRYMKDQKVNGVNLDYEGNNPNLTDGYNDLAVELCETVHSDSDANIANSQISIDVPIYPEYEGRNYDYKRMADKCDILFIMAYDGEFWDNVQCASEKSNVPCSLATSAIEMVDYGVKAYIDQGVSPSSLHLGLPWYGLKYEYVAHIPFFTGQIRYQDILNLIKTAQYQGKGTLEMDSKSSTWIFNCDGKCSQWSDLITDRSTEIWFDDYKSLYPKYKIATKYQLRGVGMWEATHVDYDPDKHTADADAMWNSLCQQKYQIGA